MFVRNYKTVVTVAFCLVVLACIASWAAIAQTETTMSMNMLKKDSFTRFTFESYFSVTYEAERLSPDTLIITFSRRQFIDLSEYRLLGSPYISSMEILSSVDEPLEIEIKIPESSRYRTFQIDERIILDVFDPSDEAEKEAMLSAYEVRQAASPPKKTEETVPEEDELESAQPEEADVVNETEMPVSVEKPAQEAMQEDETSEAETEESEAVAEEEEPAEDNIEENAADVTETPDAEEAAVTEDAVTEDAVTEDAVTEEKVLPGFDGEIEPEIDPKEPQPIERQSKAIFTNFTLERPHVITVSSTVNFGLAVYERFGRLWIVADTNREVILPQVAGPDSQLFADFERHDLKGGQAFSIPIPRETYIRAEGGGLMWRIVLTPQPITLESATVEKDFSSVEDGAFLRINLNRPKAIIGFEDPYVGDNVAIVTMARVGPSQAKEMNFIDAEFLPSYVGAAIVPKADGIQVEVTEDAVLYKKRGGLYLTAEEEEAENSRLKESVILPEGRIFAFNKWAQDDGGDFNKKALDFELMLSSAAAPDALEERQSETIENLITVAKFYLAHMLPQEALGYLRIVRQISPDMRGMPEFLAIRGAAYALSYQHKLAMNDFKDDVLTRIPEIQMWRAFVAAEGELEPDEIVYKMIPNNLEPLTYYPVKVRTRLAFAFADNALSQGDSSLAVSLMKMLRYEENDLTKFEKAGLLYYEAKSTFERGMGAEAEELYNKVIAADHPYYSTLAQLDFTNMIFEREDISIEQAQERLENIRFAWRGDNLETNILNKLGELYVLGGDERKGLNILKQAAERAKSAKQREKIAKTMQGAFVHLFSSETEEELGPIDSITIFDEFKELTPPGETGNIVLETLVDNLLAVDLLERAGNVLMDLSENRQTGQDAFDTALRAAGIAILNRQPDEALEIIDDLGRRFANDDISAESLQERELLEAKALADKGQGRQALILLSELPPERDVLRLRADTAWRDSNWAVVSDALTALIELEDISQTEVPTEEQATMLLNLAIANRLDGRTVALETIRQDYSYAMERSGLYRPFQIVTRPRQAGTLADRQTLLSLVSEVDLFQGFVENYRAADQASDPDAEGEEAAE